MKKLLVLTFAALLACGEEEVNVTNILPTPASEPDVACEKMLPGECYLGHWFQDDERCRCKRNKEECAAACGTMAVYQWNAFVCTCSVPKEW